LTPRINVAAIDDLQDKTEASTRKIVADKEFPKKVSSLKLILFTISK